MRDNKIYTLMAGLAFCCVLMAGCADKSPKVQRFGSVIGIEKDNIDEYKRLHAKVWPDVLEMIADCNIRNYSIYLAETEKGKYYLFSYFEYTGDDFAGDMDKMKADATTQKWWTHCEPLQVPVETRKKGEWWHQIEEVFHTD